MAIPTWTWSGRADRPDRAPSSEPTSALSRRATALEDGSEREDERASGGDPEASVAPPSHPSRLSRLSDEFDLLSSPARLEILLALADRERPLRYTDLRDATSIEDNGKLNYHLRRLEGLVAGRDGDDGYVLTARGRRLLERVPRAGSTDSYRTS